MEASHQPQVSREPSSGSVSNVSDTARAGTPPCFGMMSALVEQPAVRLEGQSDSEREGALTKRNAFHEQIEGLGDPQAGASPQLVVVSVGSGDGLAQVAPVNGAAESANHQVGAENLGELHADLAAQAEVERLIADRPLGLGRIDRARAGRRERQR